ncbi:hypothetical protein AB0E27_04670 [Streptomyces sparsogenes]|uniref:hypothetical protein n=1 Tax=Streptomyces sparsogenes TaxID=67365 RepID=UPI0033C7C65B
MTTSSAGQPLIPQPPATVTALRQAVAQIVPAALPAFTRELDESRQASDLAPLQRFISQWAVYIHIQRQPDLAKEFRHWEDTAEIGDATQARRAASALGKILDDAYAALGLPPR